MSSNPEKHTISRSHHTTVSVIGDGQLARMMSAPAEELGITLRLLTESRESSAGKVIPDIVVGDYRHYDDVRRAAAGSDVCTFDHEHVPTAVLDALVAQGVNVQPTPEALLHAQDKLVMRRALENIGVPVPEYASIATVDEAESFFLRMNGQICIKTCRGGYDGHGVWFPATLEECRTLVARLLDDGTALLAEERLHFRRELSVLSARRPSGEIRSWAVTESVQRNGICVFTATPAQEMSASEAEEITALAQKIARELKVTGILAVEFFDVDEHPRGRYLVNELAMRPHNTGHWTQDGSRTSQFEQHLRAVLDMPLGATDLCAPYIVMGNILGSDTEPASTDGERMSEVWSRYPHAKIHMYGKEWRPGRKLGHVTIAGCEPAVVNAELHNAVEYLTEETWLSTENIIPSGKTTPIPRVGIIMGSDSDWPTVKPAAEILADFGIPFEVGVVSAHRTPEKMLHYARTAANRGLRCIIACAGGAAHLPGMVAAATPLPVIGIPRALKDLDGLDSLLSIVQMPSGVPTATVSIGGAKNAGLLAVRILSVEDHHLVQAMTDYQNALRDDVEAKDAALRERLLRI